MTKDLITDIEKLDAALKGLAFDSSFFVEGLLPKDLTIVRRRAYRLGMRVEIRFIADDSIYVGKSGSRVWNRGKVHAQRHA